MPMELLTPYGHHVRMACALVARRGLTLAAAADDMLSFSGCFSAGAMLNSNGCDAFGNTGKVGHNSCQPGSQCWQ